MSAFSRVRDEALRAARNFSEWFAVNRTNDRRLLRMLDPRDEFWTAEFRRYAAECKRLASAAQPPATAVEPKRKRKLRLSPRPAEWLGTIARQIHKPARRQGKLVTSSAHR